MAKSKSKKKKVSEFKKRRIQQILEELGNDTTKVDYEISYLDLYFKSIEDKNFKTFSNIGKFSFYNTTYEDKDSVLILVTIIEPIDKRDSIKINETIVNAIDFLEKIFIDITNVSINRFNEFRDDTHVVLIKALKQDAPNNIIQTSNLNF